MCCRSIRERHAEVVYSEDYAKDEAAAGLHGTAIDDFLDMCKMLCITVSCDIDMRVQCTNIADHTISPTILLSDIQSLSYVELAWGVLFHTSPCVSHSHKPLYHPLTHSSGCTHFRTTVPGSDQRAHDTCVARGIFSWHVWQTDRPRTSQGILVPAARVVPQPIVSFRGEQFLRY